MDSVTAENPRSYRLCSWFLPVIVLVVSVATLGKSIADHHDFDAGYLPGIGLMVLGVAMVSTPLWIMAATVTVMAEGIEASSYFGTVVFVPWQDLKSVGLYSGRPFWGTNRYLKLVRKKANGFTTRAIFFVPMTDNMSNFDEFVSVILTKPVKVIRRPRVSDRLLWGARELEG